MQGRGDPVGADPPQLVSTPLPAARVGVKNKGTSPPCLSLVLGLNTSPSAPPCAHPKEIN